MSDDPRVLALRDSQLAASRALRHDEAMRRGQAGYFDPESGLFVLTEAKLRDQGACCGNGCRHCPYPAEEQRRAGRKVIRS